MGVGGLLQEAGGREQLAGSFTLFPGGPDGPGSPVGPGDPWCQRENTEFGNQGRSDRGMAGLSWCEADRTQSPQCPLSSASPEAASLPVELPQEVPGEVMLYLTSAWTSALGAGAVALWAGLAHIAVWPHFMFL